MKSGPALATVFGLIVVVGIAAGVFAANNWSFWTARAQVREYMKDPDSAKFRNERYVEVDGEKVICGEYAAKNGFGAYTGFDPYIGNETGKIVTIYRSSISDAIKNVPMVLKFVCGELRRMKKACAPYRRLAYECLEK